MARGSGGKHSAAWCRGRVASWYRHPKASGILRIIILTSSTEDYFVIEDSIFPDGGHILGFGEGGHVDWFWRGTMVFEMATWISDDDICCSKKDLFSRKHRFCILSDLLRKQSESYLTAVTS